MSTNEIFGVGFAGLTRRDQLGKVATELEAVVLTQLLSTMRETVPEGGLLESSATEDLFKSLLDGEIARNVAEKSPFGLARSVVAEFENRVKAEEEAAEGPTGSPPPSGPDRAAATPRSWRI